MTCWSLPRWCWRETLLSSQNPVASTSSGWSEFDALILAGTIGHVSSLGASSFIEEEHQTWYFLLNTLCLALCQEIGRHYFLAKEWDPQLPLASKAGSEEVKGTSSYFKNVDLSQNDTKTGKLPSRENAKSSEKWMALATPWVILICCRLLRSLNQTGVQWAHRPDFGHWLTRCIFELFCNNESKFSVILVTVKVLLILLGPGSGLTVPVTAACWS